MHVNSPYEHKLFCPHWSVHAQVAWCVCCTAFGVVKIDQVSVPEMHMPVHALQDVESEAAVSGALRALMRGRTTLLIAHRLSTVRQASRIVVVKAGRVVEQGSHQQLMRLRDGVYAGMIRQAESSAAETVDASIDETGVHFVPARCSWLLVGKPHAI